MFDAHLHFEFLRDEDLMHMSMAGITDIVAAIYYCNEGVRIKCHTIEDLYARLYDYEVLRASRNRIRLYYAIGINMVSVPENHEELLARLPSYIRGRDDVVSVGEIGIEPSSLTMPDIGDQEKLFRRQVELAGELGLPIDCHTPNPPDQKLEYTGKLLDIVEDCGFPLPRTIINHASAETVELILRRGAWAMVTVQPWRNLSPLDAVKIVEKYGVDANIMINSDSSAKFSDVLAVPKTAYQMRNRGFSEEQIAQLLVANPRRCYNLQQ